MTLFHKIALAATLLALPQIARGQEASLTEPTPAPLAEQIAADVARERAVCRKAYDEDQRSARYKLPQAETCAAEVEGAEMLLKQYDFSRQALAMEQDAALFAMDIRKREAYDAHFLGRPLPMPLIPGESDEQIIRRKSDYHQQSANADIAKMTAERQCVADKAKIGDVLKTHRSHYEIEFTRTDKELPFLLRFPSYGAVKTAMFAMLDNYQKETDAISCAVVR